MHRIAVILALLISGCATAPVDGTPEPVDEEPPMPPLFDDFWRIDDAPNGTITRSYTIKAPEAAACTWSYAIQVADSAAFRSFHEWSVDGFVQGSETEHEWERGESGFRPPIIQARTPHGDVEFGGSPATYEPFAYRRTTTGTVHGEFTFWLGVSGLGHWNNTLLDHLVELSFACDGPVELRGALAGHEFHLFTPPSLGNGVYVQQFHSGLAMHLRDGHAVAMYSPIVKAHISIPAVGAGAIERRHPGGTETLLLPSTEPVADILGGPGEYGIDANHVAAGTFGIWASYLGVAEWNP